MILALTAGDNDDGELDAHWYPVDRSRGYELQVGDDPPTNARWRPGELPSSAKQGGRGRAVGTKKVKSP